MTRSGSNTLFPSRDPVAITDAEFLRALTRIKVPYYLYKQRYSQFCIETNRQPDWPLFLSIIGPEGGRWNATQAPPHNGPHRIP